MADVRIVLVCPRCQVRVEVLLGSSAWCAGHGDERIAMELVGVVERIEASGEGR